MVERQSQHLKRLIDDLLDVGRVMTGKILLEREPLDLADSARHVASTLETAGRLAQRHLEVEVEPGVGQRRPDAHRADRHQPAGQRRRLYRAPAAASACAWRAKAPTRCSR